MAKCPDIEPRLAEYVEGELTAEDRAAVEEHLRKCPPCQSRAGSERVAREVMCARRATLRCSAPPGLHQRCAAQRQSAAAPMLMRTRPWVPLSVAASLVLAAALFLVFGWGSSVETYAAQLTADHLKCFQFPPPSTASPDVGVLGRAWQESAGWPLRVSLAAAPDGLQLLGIRRCGSSRGRLAHILYRWRGEPLSVYVLNRQFDRAPDAAHDHDVTRLGEHAIVWAHHERTYAVVGDRRVPDLHRVALYVRRSIE